MKLTTTTTEAKLLNICLAHEMRARNMTYAMRNYILGNYAQAMYHQMEAYVRFDEVVDGEIELARMRGAFEPWFHLRVWS